MRNSPDPSVHRQREDQMIQHVERLLDDDRVRVDTTLGRRPINTLIRDVSKTDRGVDLKRLMSEMGLPDRDLEARMPRGQSIEVVLSRSRFFFFKKPVGRLEVHCISPDRDLLLSQNPRPLGTAEVTKMLGEFASPKGGVPTTLVLLSTSGFSLDAHELAERRADRTLIMVEPNDSGGWTVTGPVETKALTDLFDPEAEDAKRKRVREYIEAARAELFGSGIATDRVASRTQLPLQMIENELKSYAKENPGLAAKRLDGRVVLFRESAAMAPMPGGSDMPFLERVKSLFARKGDNEKKVAFLAERRAALSQQRDRAYEEMSALDQQEAQLKQQFKDAGSALTKRRITSQMLQLRKDLERRHQLLNMLNQQVNVVSTHLHNLELVQQGQAAKLPDTEEMAQDAAAAEEMLAQLEADNELAAEISAGTTTSLSAEEQALYEELEKETGAAAKPQADVAPPQKVAEAPRKEPTPPQSQPAPAQRRPTEAEPG